MKNLAQQLDQVARGARRMLLTQRVAAGVVAAVVALAVLGPLDYWLRLPGLVRLVMGVVLLVVGSWRLGPGLVRAWRFRPARAGLARRLEDRVPALRGRLVSALEFELSPTRFAPPQASALTASLAATALARTGRAAQAAGLSVHLKNMVNPAPTRGWLAAGLGALVLVIATLAAAPGPGVTALQRWFMPLGAASWPARVALDAPPLTGALPVDAPAALRVRVTRGAGSGLRVWAHHRFVDGPQAGTGGAELMTVQEPAGASVGAWASGSQPAEFRLNWDAPRPARRAVESGAQEALAVDVWFSAGDGATAPQRVAWVARPRLVAATARVQAPDYAAGRVTVQTPVLDPAGDTLSARAGSVVLLGLSFNKALDPAQDPLELMPALAALPGATLTWPTARSAELTWTLRDTVSSAVSPVDAHGLGAAPPPVLRFVAQADAPPRVAWITPEADRSVLATARLPVAAQAGDDLAVAQLSVSGARQPAAAPAQDGSGSEAPVEPSFVLGQSTEPRADVQVSAVLDLAARGAQPGDTFVLAAQAQDIYDLDGQRHPLAHAPARRITVITPAQLTEQLRADLSAVRRQAVRLERDQAALAQRDPDAATPTSTSNPAARQAAEQSRLSARLQAPTAQLDAVAQRIDINALDEPALATLVRDAAAKADQAHAAGAAAAQALDTGGPGALDAAQPQQEAARAALAELSALLDRGRDALDLKLELARLRTEQDRLAQDTRALLPHTVGRAADTLDPAQRQALDDLAQRQAALAQAAAAAVSGMQRAAESLATDADAAQESQGGAAPGSEELAAGDRARAAAQALAQAAAVAQRQGLTPELQDSAQAVADNRLAQAGSGQLGALSTLDAMLEQLGEEASLHQAILKRRQLELIDQLRQLVDDQSAELKALGQAAAAGDPLAELAGAQSRLWVRTVAAQTLARAAQEQEGLGAAQTDVVGHLEAAAQGQTQAQSALTAGSAADAQAAQASALSALERALAAARAAQDDASQDAARDARAALRKAYTELAQHQDDLRTTTAAAEPAPGAALPRRARAALRGLATEQTQLRTDAGVLAQEVESTLVFKHIHVRIDTTALAAAQALRAGDPGRAARAQNRVATLLRAMAAALEDPEKTQDFAQADAPSGGGGGGGGAGQDPPLVPPLSELLLLRSMQQAVYDETRHMHDAPAADAGPRAAELGAQQREIADLAHRLMQQAAPAQASPIEELFQDP